MKKLFKILAVFLASVVLLVLVGIIALLVLVDPNDYKPQLQTLAAQQNVELNIEGDLGWSFYPQLGITAGKFSVKPAIKTITKPLQFDGLTISVKLLPLLQRQIIVDHIAIRGEEISIQDETGGNITTIKNLLLESSDLNLDQRAFPLSISMQVSTTVPARNVSFKLKTQISVDQQIKNIALNPLSIQLDKTDMTGDIQATLGSKPFLKVNLAGSELDVDQYFPSAVTPDTASTASSSENKKARNKSSDDEELIPASKIIALPGDYRISFKTLVVKHLRAAPFDVDLAISQEGLLTLKQLKASAYGGEFTMHGSVDAKPTQPQVKMNIKLDNLSLEPAMKDYFQIDKTFASGDFAFQSAVTTQGTSYNQLIQALGGDFSFASKKITLNKVDLTSSLDATLLQILQVKLPKLMSNENETVLSDMVGKGVMARGIVDNTSLTALGPCLQMDGTGTYNLANAAVDYYLDITFPSASTEKLCADINPKLQDIAWPIACKGSLDDGAANICGVDKDALQSTLAKSLKKESSQKLEKKLDETLKKKFGEDADAIKNTLKGLF